ncbi:MAG: Uma2 family endonuclease [Chloroflexota bacterium]|nr:Uma2 family endonuclease [Chloroflexota bacterium]
MAVARRQFTVTEYQRMADTGILHEDDRVELIDGEIFEMSPLGSRHVACVNRLVANVSSQVGQTVIVSVQNPIQLTDYSQPQPDLALLRRQPDFYAEALPTALDVFLLIEVADTSLAYDRDVKVPRYAETNIPEVWLVNVEDETVLVYTQPNVTGYRMVQQFQAGQVIRATTIVNLEVEVDDIF